MEVVERSKKLLLKKMPTKDLGRRVPKLTFPLKLSHGC